MAHRILHCGKSLRNYNLCIEQKLAGFKRRGASTGDIVFLAVKSKKSSVCGLRAVLGDPTDKKPWGDAENYVSCFVMDEVGYCEPFDLKILRQVGGQSWGARYFQGAKEIKEENAIRLLEDTFNSNKRDKPFLFTVPDEEVPEEETTDDTATETIEEPGDFEEPISIMGTFQTIKFRNETDHTWGLETLVNDNFYNCFPSYLKDKTLLIPENRLFVSAGVEARGDGLVRGIKAIPDALLILFNKQFKPPFQINLIEYECFGELRIKAQDKSDYLNGQVIPQLMRFASAFSIVTDKHIREQTIKSWSEKIISYIFENEELRRKVYSWVKEVYPNLSEGLFGLKIHSHLEDAFKSSLRVILIIDELSSEQKQTISNVIKAFKLDNGESTDFLAYVIRLEQKISVIDETAEYALSVQQ